MALPTVTAYNLTPSPIFIDDLGLTIPGFTIETLTNFVDFWEISGSEDLNAKIISGDILIGDGLIIFSDAASSQAFLDISGNVNGPTSGTSVGQLAAFSDTAGKYLQAANASISGGTFSITADVTPGLNATYNIGSSSSGWQYIFLGEKASAPAMLGGSGAIYVKDDSPTTLHFVDDAGTDSTILTSNSNLGLTPTLGNTIVGSGSVWESLTPRLARARVESDAPIISVMEGSSFEDDFHWTPSSTARPGILNWTQTTISTAPTYSTPTGTETGVGIRRISTALTANSGGHIRSNDTLFIGLPAIGTRWTVKLAQVTTGAASGWSGFTTSISLVPTTAANLQFLGVRWTSNGTIEGVTKTGVSTETTTSLGVAMTAGTFRCVGFDIVDVGGGSKGVQWWTADLSNRDNGPVITNVGTPITSTLPTAANLYASAMGVTTTDGTNQQADIDFWAMKGRHKRG